VGVVLVGFSALDQVTEVAAASNGEGLSASELARIEELYASDFALRQPSTAT
jgi:aryl-alcohol dehydrogenase-like predicted oxidoreductase